MVLLAEMVGVLTPEGSLALTVTVKVALPVEGLSVVLSTVPLTNVGPVVSTAIARSEATVGAPGGGDDSGVAVADGLSVAATAAAPGCRMSDAIATDAATASRRRGLIVPMIPPGASHPCDAPS
ncbi:hypothetical protein NS206_16745 [Microbacterium testaceum]|nr:hypothetical protein NS206_16745 [Microbacterium testaceum]